MEKFHDHLMIQGTKIYEDGLETVLGVYKADYKYLQVN